MPRGLSVGGVVAVLRLMMSHRACWAFSCLSLPCTTGKPAVIASNTASDTTPRTRIHLALIFILHLPNDSLEDDPWWGRAGMVAFACRLSRGKDLGQFRVPKGHSAPETPCPKARRAEACPTPNRATLATKPPRI